MTCSCWGGSDFPCDDDSTQSNHGPNFHRRSTEFILPIKNQLRLINSWFSCGSFCTLQIIYHEILIRNYISSWQPITMSFWGRRFMWILGYIKITWKGGKKRKVIIIFKAKNKWHWDLSASLFHFVRADNQIILAPISGESWKWYKTVFVFLELLGQFSTREPEIATI